MERPTVIGHYTRHMVGVDLFNQMVNYYSFARRTMRWTKKVTTYLLQLAIQNLYSVYIRYSAEEKKKTLLEYQDTCAEALVFLDKRKWQPCGDDLQHADDLRIEERFDQLPDPAATLAGMGGTPASASASPSDDPDDTLPTKAPTPPPHPDPPAAFATPPPPTEVAGPSIPETPCPRIQDPPR